MGIFVCMLRCSDGSYYIGSATGDDLEHRTNQHHAGAHRGYTYARRPAVLRQHESSVVRRAIREP